MLLNAIITTDTSTKEISIEFEIDGTPVTIGCYGKRLRNDSS